MCVLCTGSRCHLQGKLKFRDAGEAARHVWQGDNMGFYKCPHCKKYHLTKKKRRG